MADRPPEQTPESAPAALTHRQILYIVSGLLMGIFLTAMEQTVVATSIRVIADDFGGYSQQARVTTAYLVTSTIVTPLYGKLSYLFGRKPSYLFAVTVFMLGSTACACATSMYELAALRAVQGIGAGGLSVLAFTILGEIVAPGNAPATRVTSWRSSPAPVSSVRSSAASCPTHTPSRASPAGAGPS
ncbi:MFS transporter [Streptomyces sp. NPDC001617]